MTTTHLYAIAPRRWRWLHPVIQRDREPTSRILSGGILSLRNLRRQPINGLRVVASPKRSLPEVVQRVPRLEGGGRDVGDSDCQ
jgi:hypothetical protein